MSKLKVGDMVIMHPGAIFEGSAMNPYMTEGRVEKINTQEWDEYNIDVVWSNYAPNCYREDHLLRLSHGN